MNEPLIDRRRALLAELRNVLAGLVEARLKPPKGTGQEAYEDEDFISMAESRVRAAITVAKHKTPDGAVLAARLDVARERLTEVAERRPLVCPLLDRIARAAREARETFPNQVPSAGASAGT